MSAGRYAPPNWPAWTGPLAYGHATATRIASVTLVRSIDLAAAAAGRPATQAAWLVAVGGTGRGGTCSIVAHACDRTQPRDHRQCDRWHRPEARTVVGPIWRPAVPSAARVLHCRLHGSGLDLAGVRRPGHREKLARVHVARAAEPAQRPEARDVDAAVHERRLGHVKAHDFADHHMVGAA